MDGFIALLVELLAETGIRKPAIFVDTATELPGFFRAEKKWDLIVVADDELIACIEAKSQVGPSFGNNFNNRTEEAIGSATDLWTAYREGAFRVSRRPWLGYLMLLEESSGSTSAVAVREPHFQVFEEFREASYRTRYAILLTKLLRERLYDSACLITSKASASRTGAYHEPSDELSFRQFAAPCVADIMHAAIIVYAATRTRSASRRG